MLNNRVLLIFSGIAVIAVVVVSIYLLNNKKRVLSPVLDAIPTKTAFILETDDFSYLMNKISKNENIYQIMSDLLLTDKFFKDFTFLDSVIRTNKSLKSFINQKTVALSAHSVGQNDLGFLFVTGSFNPSKDFESAKELFTEILPDKSSELIVFDGAEIIKQDIKKKKKLYYTFYEKYFLISFSEIILQKAIKNINSGSGLFSDQQFKSLYEKAGTKNDAKLFINYKQLFNTTGKFFNENFAKKKFLLQNFAEWTAFDMNIKRKEIKLSGHTILKPELQYLNIFKNQKPGESEILKILPEKTSSFLILNIGKGNSFKYRYEEYLADTKELNEFQIRMASYYKNFKLNENEHNLYQYIDSEIAYIHEDLDKTGKNHNIYTIFRVSDKTKVANILQTLTKNYCIKNNLNTGDYLNLLPYDKGEFKINKIPRTDLPEMHFGILFNNVKAEYYTFIKDFIIFGENIESLRIFIDSNKKDRTFKRKSQNYKFIQSLPDESNIFFYIDLFHSKKIINDILVDEKSKLLSEDINLFFSLQGPAIQYISDSYPIYTICNFSLNSREQQISETIWEVRLDTLIATKPFIVVNHNTNEKEIIIQDKANKIYLIDKTGKILWTRQLDGKIISEIHQIDYYNNNKLQLIFNTKKKIYCIDRIGNWLEGYPVNLKSEATNGISLIDYDNNKNYRIFIATIDKKISLFDKDGNKLEGWLFDKTKSNVYGNIKLYRKNDKDYVVFRDLTDMYIVNRRGQIRVNPEVKVPLSENTDIFFSEGNQNEQAKFTVSNPSGTIYSIYENGKVEKKEFQNQSKNHVFSYIDINGDKSNDFIFTDKDKTTVYDGITNNQIFTYNYRQEIKKDISFYEFGSKDVRIGASSRDKIFLIDNKGKLCEGFPLIGSGLFSITIFDSINEFSLIVGNKDNYLYKYKIK